MMNIEYNAKAVIEHLTAQKYRVTVERDRLIDDKISLVAQRDELLAALKKVRPMISQECGCTSDFEEVGLKIIDDAISKCEAQS